MARQWSTTLRARVFSFTQTVFYKHMAFNTIYKLQKSYDPFLVKGNTTTKKQVTKYDSMKEKTRNVN